MSEVPRDAEDLELLQLLTEEQNYQDTHKFYDMYPDDGPLSRAHYPKQIEFFKHGASFVERTFMGGNGTGKTWGVAAYEATCHLTGEYPHWWVGKRFNHAVQVWMSGDTRETVRDIIQAKMLGDIAKEGEGVLGTGMVPRSRVASAPRYVQNTNKAVDFILVKHISGAESTLQFKAYEQGRKSFQGTEKHVIVLDEEPPYDVYLECLMRTRTVGGIILMTYTPLSGRTQLVIDFLSWEKKNREGGSKYLVVCSWDDVPHLDPEWKRNTEAATPPYLREARKRGIPVAGAGKIYPVEEDLFVINPVPIQPHWRRCFGFDHGYYNTAACWFAYDKDLDTAYIYSDYKRGEVPLDLHAMAIKARGDWIPGAGDAAAKGDVNSAQKVVDMYRARGVKLRLPNKAVDAGIMEVLSRLSTGRLKVFNTCQKWLDEYRMYSYNEHQDIVKDNDHLMDATRYGVMSGLSIAVTQQLPSYHIGNVKFG